MDIYKEISNLPNFIYEFYDNNDSYHFAILGREDQISKPSNFSDEANIMLARDTKAKIDELYEHEVLSDKEKADLASMMIRIRDLCEKRTEKLSTLAKQKQYIENLSDDEKSQIEKQILMYKTCRCFYRDYVYKK